LYLNILGLYFKFKLNIILYEILSLFGAFTITKNIILQHVSKDSK